MVRGVRGAGVIPVAWCEAKGVWMFGFYTVEGSSRKCGYLLDFGGSCDGGEGSPVVTALRELREETNGVFDSQESSNWASWLHERSHLMAKQRGYHCFLLQVGFLHKLEVQIALDSVTSVKQKKRTFQWVAKDDLAAALEAASWRGLPFHPRLSIPDLQRAIQSATEFL